MDYELTNREQLILAAIVEDYIHSAQPVASGRVKTVSRVPLSSATIRHIMADLENSGLLSRPHTSAGKVPTDFGYRTYVDDLMEIANVRRGDVHFIQRRLEKISGDVDGLLQLLAALIARLTGSVGIAVRPMSPNARLISLGLVPAEGGRILMVLETDSADIRTVAIQTEREITGSQLISVEEILRERLCGLTLKEILATAGIRLGGTLAAEFGLAGYIIDHAGELFEEGYSHQIYSHGLNHLLQTPEFIPIENAASLAGLLEDVERLKSLVVTGGHSTDQVVTIGTEHDDDELSMLSVIRQGYYIGDNFGTLAVLAPKRVDYRQVCALLDYLATTLNERLGSGI